MVNTSDLPWPPGTPVRVESNGYGDDGHHEEMAEKLASALAARGYPIDPDAELRVRVTTEKKVSEAVLEEVDNPTQAQRAEAARNPVLANPGGGGGVPVGTYVMKKVPGYKCDGKVRCLDAAGTAVGPAILLFGEAPASNPDAVYQELRSHLYRSLSPGSVLDHRRTDPRGGTRELGTSVPVGVDGLLEQKFGR